MEPFTRGNCQWHRRILSQEYAFFYGRLLGPPDVDITCTIVDRQSCLWGAQTPMGIYTEANEISTLVFAGVNSDQCVYGSYNDAYYKVSFICVRLTW